MYENDDFCFWRKQEAGWKLLHAGSDKNGLPPEEEGSSDLDAGSGAATIAPSARFGAASAVSGIGIGSGGVAGGAEGALLVFGGWAVDAQGGRDHVGSGGSADACMV